MRRFNASLALAAAACLGVSGVAHAARWHVGVYLGGPVYPYYAPVVPAPYYYAPYPPYAPYAPYAPYPPPPVVVVPEQPDSTYVERPRPGFDGQPQDQPQQGTWWYCDKTKTYYPYVKQCASGWREVPATPPAPNQ